MFKYINIPLFTLVFLVGGCQTPSVYSNSSLDEYNILWEARNTKSLRLQLIMADSRNKKTLSALAGNPNLHPEAQMVLVKYNSNSIILALINNDSLVPATHKILAEKSDIGTDIRKFFTAWVVKTLAKKKNLPIETQRLLAYSKKTGARRNLAQNGTIAPEIQAILANDRKKSVRKDLLKNRFLQPEIREILNNNE